MILFTKRIYCAECNDEILYEDGGIHKFCNKCERKICDKCAGGWWKPWDNIICKICKNNSNK